MIVKVKAVKNRFTDKTTRYRTHKNVEKVDFTTSECLIIQFAGDKEPRHYHEDEYKGFYLTEDEGDE